MKERHTQTNDAKPSLWQRTQYSNLIRYIPSGTYFARVRVSGKLIRKKLRTDVLSVAKLRLADFVKEEREAAVSNDKGSRGLMTFGDCVKLFLDQTETSNLLKPKPRRSSVTGLLTVDVNMLSQPSSAVPACNNRLDSAALWLK